jgi:hypothetical protein
MVSVAPGTSGPVGTYCRREGESTAQDPATAGLKVGMGLPGAKFVENSTEMVEPATTLVPVGETDATVRAGGGALGVAAACVPRCSTATKPPAARRSATAQTVNTTHRRGRFCVAACSPELMASGILPGSSRA